MKCERCDNEGTHTEWLVDGKVVPIARECGRLTAICDTCHDYYESLRKTYEALVEAGVPRHDANLHMMRRIEADAEGRGQS